MEDQLDQGVRHRPPVVRVRTRPGSIDPPTPVETTEVPGRGQDAPHTDDTSTRPRGASSTQISEREARLRHLPSLGTGRAAIRPVALQEREPMGERARRTRDPKHPREGADAPPGRRLHGTCQGGKSTPQGGGERLAFGHGRHRHA